MAYIYNSASNTLLSGTSDDDSIENYGDSVTINAGAGNDYIENYYGLNVTIDAGAGNDYIHNYNGHSVSINAGAGNDSIDSWSYYVKIEAGNGDDSISFGGNSVTINAGAGNDYVEDCGNTAILNDGNSNSINAGAGNDTLYISSDGGDTLNGGTGSDLFIFYYDTDDAYGTDTITDYEEADTIQFQNVAVSKVSTNSSGSVIFKAGDNKLVVKNAADKVVTYIDSDGTTKTFGGGITPVTINNTTNNTLLSGTSGNDSIQNGGDWDGSYHLGGDNVTITAGAGNDYIHNYNGHSVSINAGAGNDSIDSWSYYVKIEAGNGDDSISFGGNSVTINAGAGNDSISNSGAEVSIDGGAGNDTLFTYSDGGKTVTGGTGSDIFIFYYDTDDSYGTDTITDYEEADTIQFDNLAVSKISTNNSGSVIFMAGDNKLVVKNAADKIITYIDADGSTKTFGGSTDSKLITLTDGNDTYSNSLDGATINALGGNDSIENYGAEVSINAGAGNDSIYNYTNTGDADIAFDSAYEGSVVTLSGGAGDDYIYNDFYDYVSISGGTGSDTIYNYNGTSLTIAAGAGDDSIYNWDWKGHDSIDGGAGSDTITNHSDGGKTVTGGTGSDIFIFYYDTDDSYGTDTITDYEEADTIQFNNVAVSKVSTNNSGSVIFKAGDNKLVVKNAADKIITYIDADGSTKTFGSGSADEWKLDGTTATYGSLTVKGVTSLDGLSVSGKVVTVSAASLGTSKVTISDGYTLALGSDVSSASTKKSWSLSKTTATYKQTTTAGYSLEDNAIIYTEKSSKTLATVKGVKSLDGLKLSGKVVTVSAASLGTSKVTISDGYTLALGSDVSSASTKKAWSLSKTTATYKQTTTAGYFLEDNAITYTKKSSKTLATVKGVKSLDGLSVSGKVVTVSAASLGTSKVTISDGYTLKLGSDVSSSTTKKSWSLSKTTATYKQTTTAGYSLDDNAITYTKKSSKTLATVKGATSKSGLKVSGKTIKLSTSALSKKVTVSGAYTFDFADDYSKATITGSSSADTIVARGKKISVKGGAGNDTLKILGTGTLTGGAGADIFALKSTAANIISDYAAEDKISLTSGTADFSVKGGDLLLNDKVTLTGAADKSVTYIEGGVEKIYTKPAEDTEAVKLNGAGTGVTLTVHYNDDTFDAADYAGSLVTIKASDVLHTLTITGNKNANKIVGTCEEDYIDGLAGSDTISGGKGDDTLIGGAGSDSLNGGAGEDSLLGGDKGDILLGGAGNDTLWGNKGDDTLTGGAGDDIFIYEDGDGKDIISDYLSVDKVIVLSGKVESPSVDVDGNVIFKVGSGQITFPNSANKYIELLDEYGNIRGGGVYKPPTTK